MVQQFAAHGHSVVGLTRNDEGEKTVRSAGGEPRRASLFDEKGLTDAAKGSDVVVHAATAIPTKVRTTAKDWAMNDRIRREGTKALSAAAGNIGASAYLQQSVVWAVRGPEGKTFDEDAPPSGDPILASSLDGERIAQEAGRDQGFRTGVLRLGGFYSADGWHTRILGESLSRGRPVLVNQGSAIWSLIHSDDAASAFVAASERPKAGVWHVIDDKPVAMSEYLNAMATRLSVRPPRHMPRWLARLFLGRYTAELLASSFPTTNVRFREAFSWRPSFPTYAEGLDEIVATWRAQGFPAREA
jgi:nucleoside-diphosphate-sugar epimerase